MNICSQIKDIVLSRLSDIISLRNTGRLKDDNTFVSDGDLLCQQIIEDTLSSLLPNLMIISEEKVNNCSSLSDYDYIATIDPIDGTENFVSGLKEWGVGVSIYKDMRHLESMILLPELELCLKTGDKIDRYTNSRICGLSSYMKSDDFTGLDRDYEYRIMGCCMYNMHNVITGSYARFEHLKGCYSWDILPGMNLAIEHGLKVIIDDKIYNGEFLLPGKRYRFSVFANDNQDK